MNNGFVILHRSINDNKLWLLEPFTKAQAWVDLFLNANWKDGSMSIRGNIIDIKRGQIGWSESTMSARWKWSRNKVRLFLLYLTKEGNIVQQKGHLTTVTTICKYEDFQNDQNLKVQQKGQQKVQQKDSRRTAEGTRMNKVNKVNKENKGNKESNKHCASEKQLALFTQFWDAFADKRGRAPALKVWNKISPDDELAQEIFNGAKAYAVARQKNLADGATSKMAQGWLTDRRWEDELSPVNIPFRQSLQGFM